MKEIKIVIDGSKVSVKFGFGAIALLGQWWNLPGYVEVVEKVGSLVPEGDTQQLLKFENLNLLADVVIAGIVNADGENEGAEYTRGTIVDAIFQDMDMLKDVFELFMASMPQAKQPAEPPKKKRTASAKKK